MAATRRMFTDEFKREAVALWETSGRLQVDVAAELGIQPSQLRRWQRHLQGEPPRRRSAVRLAVPPSGAAPPGLTPADLASENARLKRELERTRMERDVPRKAIGIFAEVPK